ncbi:MAG: hypothetical protein GXY23_03130 [Myxococcales bacterium]|nr:hypothetical protein [Myxococcales bacterium]
MFRFPPPTRLLKILVGGLAIAFVVEALADNWQGIGLVRLLALRVGDLHLGALWQVFTYPLAIFTPQIFSVLIQLFFCWWIIGDFERNVGTETTVMLLVFTSVGTGLVVFALGLFLPMRSYLTGPWPMVLGAISAMAWRLRGRGTMNLYGVVPMKAEHLLIALGVFSLVVFIVSKDLIDLVGPLVALGLGIAFTEWTRRGGGSGIRKQMRRGFRVIEGGRKDKRWMN